MHSLVAAAENLGSLPLTFYLLEEKPMLLEAQTRAEELNALLAEVGGVLFLLRWSPWNPTRNIGRRIDMRTEKAGSLGQGYCG